MTSFDPRLRLVFLTDASQTQRPLVDVVGEAIQTGVRAVIVREKNLPEAERSSIVKAVAAKAQPVGCMVLAASRSFAKVDGIHLAANDHMPVNRPRIVGRSCHSLQEVYAAERQGCDYATLSPIFLTRSKPGYGPALGTRHIELVTNQVDIPIVALGGINQTNAASCVESGASGVAVMGEIMRSLDVGRLVGSLCTDLGVPSAYPGNHD